MTPAPIEPAAPRRAPWDAAAAPDLPVAASAARPLRVLVTGATGFVGGALVRRLRDDSRYEVIGVGRRPLDDALYRSIDLAAPDAGARLDALGFVPDVIVHAAARSSPWGTKAEFERDNVQVTRTILDFAHRAGTAAARPEVAGADGATTERAPSRALQTASGSGASESGSGTTAPRAAASGTVAASAASRAAASGTVAESAAPRAAASGTAARAEAAPAAPAAPAAAAARTTEPRVVFVSTASVLYRAADQLDVADDALVPRPFVNDYAASKFAAEHLVRAYPGEWTVLRPRAVFGPGDTTVFPRVLAAAERGRLPEFRATVLSDLIYIDTLVDYLERALTAPGVPGQTITLTNGEPVDLQTTVRALLLRAGVPLPRRRVSRRGALWAATAVEGLWRLARRAGEPPITRYSVIVYAYSKTFDPALCRRLLGVPSVTVADGLERYAKTLDERLR